jgi:histidyl-tRNA synthetase
VLVTQFDREGMADGLQLAADVRALGVRVEVYPEVDKLGKQFKYASARRTRFVAVVGADERAAGHVTVKDMQSGTQTQVPRAEAAHWLAMAIRGEQTN